MEIVTYVLEGALEHKDSIGTGSVIKPGDVQRMSAGTGIRHSEFNASKTEPVHFLQIWIMPEKRGLPPGYEQKTIPAEQRRGELRLIGSRDGRDSTVTIHQDVAIYAATLGPADSASHNLGDKRAAWVQIASGQATINGIEVSAGDGIAIVGEPAIHISRASAGTELLLFEMAA